MLASAEANIDQVPTPARRRGCRALVVPIEVAQYVRGLVRRGVTLPVLLRSYRLGHAWFWDRWSQALHRQLRGSPRGAGAIGVHVRLRGPDLRILVEAAAARAKHAALRSCAQTVRSILAGEPIDEELAVQSSATSCAGTWRCGCRACE